MTAKDLIDRVVTVALVTTAAVMAIRYFRGETRQPSIQAEARPSYIKDWEQLAATGVRAGSPNAQATLIEFMDFECPYCRKAEAAVDSIKEQFGAKLSVVFVHYPLSMHRFARPAARAAECASGQIPFERLQQVLFAKQDSLGLKTWTSYAAEAGVPDTTAFGKCVLQNTPMPRVEAGVAAGQRIGVRGTPTLVLNGWRFSQPPTRKDLELAIERILEGKSVVDTVSGETDRD